ncbi:2150_t:CDS:2 [Dentiscutata heterogama]|uniref:2150_t:CDS:1 n=1 Tax=Dentiscutata heterogama TaxID=1316150 RepID=A0ACA9LZI3_9GLOM|nr:2150_t:CDS:2 [Dentiscutata heterogama]
MCCSAPKWKEEIKNNKVTDHKFDFVDLDEFKYTSITGKLTGRITYSFVFLVVLKSVLIYVADIWTAGLLLFFDRWGSAIQPKIPFYVSKWIYIGSIIASFLLLAWDIRKAKRIYDSRDISYAFTNIVAYRAYTLKSYAHFCFFSKINNSQKLIDKIAFFVFFSFKGWKRLLFAEAPRQAINGTTLFFLIQLNKSKQYLDINNYGDSVHRLAMATMAFSLFLFRLKKQHYEAEVEPKGNFAHSSKKKDIEAQPFNQPTLPTVDYLDDSLSGLPPYGLSRSGTPVPQRSGTPGLAVPSRAGTVNYGPPTIGTLDYGPPRVGTPDYGPPRVGTPDYGPPRSRTPELGPPRVGTPDYGPPRVGTPDYGLPRSRTPELGPPRVGTPDYGPPRSRTPDYGPPRSGTPGPPRIGTPDYGPPRTGTPSYGPPRGGTTGHGPPRFGTPGYGPPRVGTPGYGPSRIGTPVSRTGTPVGYRGHYTGHHGGNSSELPGYSNNTSTAYPLGSGHQYQNRSQYSALTRTGTSSAPKTSYESLVTALASKQNQSSVQRESLDENPHNKPFIDDQSIKEHYYKDFNNSDYQDSQNSHTIIPPPQSSSISSGYNNSQLSRNNSMNPGSDIAPTGY